MSSPATTNTWNADRYAHNAHFVPALGQPALDLLKPVRGERILDLGCGDGVLTEKIAAVGATVVGVDASADMVAASQRRGLDAHVMDGLSLSFNREFDAVFSNAALHWMKSDPDRVIEGVARALKPGGRFVAEMGGHGCVAAIMVSMLAVLQKRGVDTQGVSPWYFPTVDDYKSRLEKAGFTVDYIELIPRPTPLPTAMEGWLEVFGEPMLKLLPAGDRLAARDEVIALVRPVLCDERGRWTADYIRLRFAAHLS
ncbi:MAG TPA: methyltransferase domain-containing protein [Candidatus Binataceae bacterium]|nr:methyltransferase domain-containing protein [Candidatus Binataceae bacterium]